MHHTKRNDYIAVGTGQIRRSKTRPFGGVVVVLLSFRCSQFHQHSEPARNRGKVLRSNPQQLRDTEAHTGYQVRFAIRGLMHEAALKVHEDPDRQPGLYRANAVEEVGDTARAACAARERARFLERTTGFER